MILFMLKNTFWFLKNFPWLEPVEGASYFLDYPLLWETKTSCSQRIAEIQKQKGVIVKALSGSADCHRRSAEPTRGI